MSDAYLNTQDNVYQAMQAPELHKAQAFKDTEQEYQKLCAWLDGLRGYDFVWDYEKNTVSFKVTETQFVVQKNQWIVYNDSKGKFVILDMHEFEVLFA